jgi:cytokinin dehydrogenase
MDASLRKLCQQKTGVLVENSNIQNNGRMTDFSNMLSGECGGVLKPDNPEQIIKILAFANYHQLKITVRANGLSQSGQAIPVAGSLVIDMTGFNSLDKPDKSFINCGAGATWRDVIQATMPHGLIPLVLPLNLDLTVGGVLSAGGIGASSHRHSVLVDHIYSAQVITATGENLFCSHEQHPDLFAGVLGGQGRFAIIVAVKLALRVCHAKVQTLHLLYDDCQKMLADQQRLATLDQVHYMEGFCADNLQGFKAGDGGWAPFSAWFYPLQISQECLEPTKLPFARELENLAHWRKITTSTSTLSDYLLRYTARFTLMRNTGAWQLPHPWFECFLPLTAVERLLPKILAAMPAALGSGHRLFYLAKPRHRSQVSLPNTDDNVLFAILPMAIPPNLLPSVLEYLNDVQAACLEAGGKRYLSGWLGEMTQARWQQHYGTEKYMIWTKLKQRYDPDARFQSLLYPPLD